MCVPWIYDRLTCKYFNGMLELTINVKKKPILWLLKPIKLFFFFLMWVTVRCPRYKIKMRENSCITVAILTSEVREEETNTFLLLEVIFLILTEDKKACMVGVLWLYRSIKDTSSWLFPRKHFRVRAVG